MKSTVQINAYEVIARAVEDGIAMGLRRAHKHTEAPSKETIAEHLQREIMNELCEVLRFEP